MKLKVLNVISGVLFFCSSLSLLLIPFLSNDEISIAEFAVATMFWVGLLAGTVIQIMLFLNCKKQPKTPKTKARRTIEILFFMSCMGIVPTMLFFNKNEFVLPINLFFILIFAQTSFVLKRMEDLK